MTPAVRARVIEAMLPFFTLCARGHEMCPWPGTGYVCESNHGCREWQAERLLAAIEREMDPEQRKSPPA